MAYQLVQQLTQGHILELEICVSGKKKKCVSQTGLA